MFLLYCTGMNSRAALTPATPPAAWAGKRTAMEKKEAFFLRPAAWKVMEAAGLKLAPPKISPMAEKVMTRMLTKTVEMKRGTRGSVWTPRKAANLDEKIFRRGMENTHMDVNKKSPMATLITPMADFELRFGLRIGTFSLSFGPSLSFLACPSLFISYISLK
ncbi:hypothetical protein GQ457_09G025970 [Hibiscus cannabinus]